MIPFYFSCDARVLTQSFNSTMQNRWITLVFCLISGMMQAQITLKVTSIPANTPAGSAIYAAGTFNNWNPGDAAAVLADNGSGVRTLTINPPAGQVKFKFTRGSWATVEGNANGVFLPDRVINYNGQATTVQLTILSWEDLGSGGGNGSTAAANVQIINNNFYIPQLNRYRRIWVYLPPDYASSGKSYPVLYMHDGQNLFDANTSFAGEWEVDESLNSLHAQGDYGCIVVGIDNGGQYRLDEYSPWINTQYGGGQGDEYVEFIINTLKPYVDGQYRTLPYPYSTGIMGSSMGGLISMYAFSERQDVFSRAGVFSPAFWFATNQPANHVANHPKQGPARVYFLAGGDEPEYVTTDMQAVANAMNTAGFSSSERKTVLPSDGSHAEWFWKREFPAAYQWLFSGAVTDVTTPESTAHWDIYPNPAMDYLRLSGLKPDQTAHIRLCGLDGKEWISTTVKYGEPLYTWSLPTGCYVAEVQSEGQSKWLRVMIF